MLKLQPEFLICSNFNINLPEFFQKEPKRHRISTFQMYYVFSGKNKLKIKFGGREGVKVPK